MSSQKKHHISGCLKSKHGAESCFAFLDVLLEGDLLLFFHIYPHWIKTTSLFFLFLTVFNCLKSKSKLVKAWLA